MSMKLAILMGVLLATAGCSSMRGGTPRTFNEDTVSGFDARLFRKPEACVVNVFVIADDIVIDQEPVHTLECIGEKRIWWFLDGESIYTFANPGITAKEPQVGFPTCKVVAAGKAAWCKWASPGTGSKHRYNIHLLKSGAVWKSLDPMMIND